MIYVTILGITLGTHRLYSHRAFKANNYIQFISLLVHTMAGQVRWFKEQSIERLKETRFATYLISEQFIYLGQRTQNSSQTQRHER